LFALLVVAQLKMAFGALPRCSGAERSVAGIVKAERYPQLVCPLHELT